MKSIRLVLFTALAALAACSNLPPDDTAPFKAYPNPYNPSLGTLTIEKTSGTPFSATNQQNDLVVFDYVLNEIYRTTAIVSTGAKIYWSGIDNTGAKVAPGNYYIKVITTTSTGVEGANAMFKLIVQ